MADVSRQRATIFLSLCALGAIAIASAIHWAGVRSSSSSLSEIPVAASLDVGDGTAPRAVYFRHNGLGSDYGKLAYLGYAADTPSASFIDHLSCESVHVARNRGVCLSARRGVVTTYSAKLFATETHEVYADLPLAGVPSRTRVSVDGSVGATTVFLTGHGYDSVDFTTQTLLIELSTGTVIADLETFRVFEHGAELKNPDFNFWGVTFTRDAAHFYATLSTNRRHLLVKGDIAARTVEVLRTNVECPSLSPDGTRVAYKKRYEEGGRIGWLLHVFDLASGRDAPLTEQRSVDDQLEWLDDNHVLYSVPSADNASSTAATDVWVASVDGTSAPELFLQNAYSPAVVR